MVNLAYYYGMMIGSIKNKIANVSLTNENFDESNYEIVVIGKDKKIFYK